MNTYGAALILGDIQWFPFDVSKHLSLCLYFVQAYIKSGTAVEALLDFLVEERKGQIQCLIEPLTLINDEMDFNSLDESFNKIKCECLLIFTHNTIEELPQYILAAIEVAKSYHIPFQIIRLLLPKKAIDYIRTGQAIRKERERLGVAVNTLSKSINRRGSEILSIENGTIKPRAKTYKAIAMSLDCAVEDFLKYE